jgi:hypothetical protein
MGRMVRRRKQLLDDFTEKSILEKCKRKHQITLCGELALEEAMELS